MGLKRILVLFLAISCLATTCPKSDFSPQDEVANFTLPDLPYDYADLEPALWSGLLYYHHKKEHQSRVDSLNDVCASTPEYQSLGVIELLTQYGLTDESISKYAGGHYSHSLFWWMLIDPSCAKGSPSGKLLTDIEEAWGSFEAFADDFKTKASGLFGSGWIWLCTNTNGQLSIQERENDSSPLDGGEYFPFLGIDMWEHAYYLTYLYEKVNWIGAWWTIIDWELVEYWYEQYASQKVAVPV